MLWLFRIHRRLLVSYSPMVIKRRFGATIQKIVNATGHVIYYGNCFEYFLIKMIKKNKDIDKKGFVSYKIMETIVYCTGLKSNRKRNLHRRVRVRPLNNGAKYHFYNYTH